MAYKNNHFVPRLIQRRFSDRISVYDIREKTLSENQDIYSTFSNYEFYPEDIEIALGQKIENPFASILNKKILKAKVDEEIELTRSELNIVKKFLLIEQMRVYTEDSKKSELLVKLLDEMTKDFFPFKEKEIENETSQERWLRNIRVILECKDLMHIGEHELCTYEAFRWAQLYNSGYLAIWDINGGEEEFLVTDVGMTSEREQSTNIIGVEVEKKLILSDLLHKTNRKDKQQIYSNLLLAQQEFHENFYMFSISKNRIIVLINPFFRLYDKKEKLDIPNEWVSCIEDKKLFEKNRSEILPIAFGRQVLSDSDRFWYKVHPMDINDVIWVNMLMLDRIDRFVGFSSIEKVAESIYYYIDWHKERNLTPPKDYEPLLKILKERKIIED